MFFAAIIASLSGQALAIDCMDFNGFAAPDSDRDCVADVMSEDLPEGAIIDNCPGVPNGDCDENPSYCDIDGDGILSEREYGAGFQADWNRNGIGDACDDTDSDGFSDYIDNCRLVFDLQNRASYCIDADHDGWEDEIDNCPYEYNNLQTDSDGDGIGDACDNCQLVYNPNQLDSNSDRIGDACPEQARANPGASRPIEHNPNLYEFPYDKTKGNGGCSISGSGNIGPTGILLAIVFLFISKRIRNRRPFSDL